MAEEPDDTTIDPSPPPPAPRRNRRYGRWFVYGFLALWLVVALWNLYKPLPDGMQRARPDRRDARSPSCTF